MKVTALGEKVIGDIGHAFGYYDYGSEHGLIDAFPGRDAAAAFICGYVRMSLKSGTFAEGNRLGVPVILDTDARSKCDKYVHLGMKLVGTRRFGDRGVLYDLIKYPDVATAK